MFKKLFFSAAMILCSGPAFAGEEVSCESKGWVVTDAGQNTNAYFHLIKVKNWGICTITWTTYGGQSYSEQRLWASDAVPALGNPDVSRYAMDVAVGYVDTLRVAVPVR